MQRLEPRATGRLVLVSVFSDQGACHPRRRGCQLARPSGHSSDGHQSHCKAQTPSSSSCLKCEMGAGTRSARRQLVWLSLSHHFDAEDLLFYFASNISPVFARDFGITWANKKFKLLFKLPIVHWCGNNLLTTIQSHGRLFLRDSDFLRPCVKMTQWRKMLTFSARSHLPSLEMMIKPKWAAM